MDRQKVKSRLKQFISYFFVGGIAAIVDYGVANLIYLVMTLGRINSEWIVQNVSSLLGILVGLLVNYFISLKFVFHANKNLKDFLQICLITVISCMLTFILTSLNTKYFGVPFMFFKGITMGAIFVWNYLARSLWVYNKPCHRTMNMSEHGYTNS